MNLDYESRQALKYAIDEAIRAKLDCLPRSRGTLSFLGRDVKHGSRVTYQAGCRCVPCGVANREYQKQWRLKKAVA